MTTPPSRIVSACPSCGKGLPAPVELWADGVCKLSRSFCKRHFEVFAAEYERIGGELEYRSWQRLAGEQMDGVWAGAGCDDGELANQYEQDWESAGGLGVF